LERENGSEIVNRATDKVVYTQLANGESTVVGFSTINLKIEGSNPAFWRGKMAVE
jgi:hypothetical protein